MPGSKELPARQGFEKAIKLTSDKPSLLPYVPGGQRLEFIPVPMGQNEPLGQGSICPNEQ